MTGTMMMIQKNAADFQTYSEDLVRPELILEFLRIGPKPPHRRRVDWMRTVCGQSTTLTSHHVMITTRWSCKPHNTHRTAHASNQYKITCTCSQPIRILTRDDTQLQQLAIRLWSNMACMRRSGRPSNLTVNYDSSSTEHDSIGIHDNICS